jgi:uncharacterized protein YkwD
MSSDAMWALKYSAKKHQFHITQYVTQPSLQVLAITNDVRCNSTGALSTLICLLLSCTADQTVTTPTASSKGAKIIVNTLRMITREESDKAAAAAAVEATVAAAAAAAAADSDSGVSIARAAMSPQQNKIVLDTHNKYRSWHQVGALAWSDTVAAAAMDYASKCTWNHDPNNNAYGENLYATSETSGDLSTYLQDAVDGWVSHVIAVFIGQQ